MPGWEVVVTSLTRSVSFPHAENDILMIDFSAACGIISMKRALPISGQLKVNSFLWNRNRHLAEWRFLLFTQIVVVILPIWNVSVIGICSPPLRSVADRLSAVRRAANQKYLIAGGNHTLIYLWQCSFRPQTRLALFNQ